MWIWLYICFQYPNLSLLDRSCFVNFLTISSLHLKIPSFTHLLPLYLTFTMILALIPFGAVVQSPSCVWLFVTPWTAAQQAFLSFTTSQSLFKLMSIKSVMPSSHLILCRPLLLPSIFPSIRVFPNESALYIRWPKYRNFIFSISLSNESSGLTFFRIDWFELLDVQGTLKSLLQHHNLKASVLQPSAFFMAQLSHQYMTTGKIIALTIHALNLLNFLQIIVDCHSLSHIFNLSPSLSWLLYLSV